MKKGLQVFLLILIQLSFLNKKEINAQGTKPNLIVIMTDEHNFRTIGAYRDLLTTAQAFPWGEGVMVETPNLDRLADEGAICTKFYASCPVCTPSRGSFMSGIYPQETGAPRNEMQMNLDIVTFAKVLKDEGYATSYVGKWHLDGPDAPGWDPVNNFGWDDNTFMHNDGHWPWIKYDADGNLQGMASTAVPDGNPPAGTWYTTDFMADRALDILARDKDNPFCLMLSIGDPHSPDVGKQPYIDMYSTTPFQSPITLETPDEIRPNWGTGGSNEVDAFDKVAIQNYFAAVKAIDVRVGDILDYLDNNGLTNNTIVVFTSDHGDMLYEHSRVDKGISYEASARIPFLIRYPNKIPAGKVISTPYVNVDFAPTILGMMEAPQITGVHGTDCSADFISSDLNVDTDRDVYFRFIGDRIVTILNKRYKLTLSGNEPPFLFDLEKDPYELVNYANDPAYDAILRDLVTEATTKMTAYNEPALSVCLNHVPASTVSTTSVTSVAIQSNETTIEVGGIDNIFGMVYPINASNPEVNWSVANSSIATVEKAGLIMAKVTGVAEGTTTITATSLDGSFLASYDVNVVPEGTVIEEPTVDPTPTSIINSVYFADNSNEITNGGNVTLGNKLDFTINCTVPDGDGSTYTLKIMQYCMIEGGGTDLYSIKTKTSTLTGGTNDVTSTWVTNLENSGKGYVCAEGEGQIYMAIYKDNKAMDPAVENILVSNWKLPVTTAVKALKQSKIKLYPNPAKENITIEAPIKSTVSMYNQGGMLVKTWITVSENETVSIADLPKGIYLIKIVTEEATYTNKLLVE